MPLASRLLGSLFRGTLLWGRAWRPPYLLQEINLPAPVLWPGCVFWLDAHQEANPVFQVTAPPGGLVWGGSWGALRAEGSWEGVVPWCRGLEKAVSGRPQAEVGAGCEEGRRWERRGPPRSVSFTGHPLVMLGAPVR